MNETSWDWGLGIGGTGFDGAGLSDIWIVGLQSMLFLLRKERQ